MLHRFLNKAYKEVIVDRLKGLDSNRAIPDGGTTTTILVRAMFTLLGRLAKLDGPVSAEEIAFATRVMGLLGLEGRARENAIGYFNLGKRAGNDVMPMLAELIQHMGKRGEFAQLFVQLQCRAACVDGGMGVQKRMLLRNVAEMFGYNKTEFLQICLATPGYAVEQDSHTPIPVRKAYDVLQLAPGVDNNEIRRAYLRLATHHHPDKLAPQNLSEDAMEKAREQFADIRNAYEVLSSIHKARA